MTYWMGPRLRDAVEQAGPKARFDRPRAHYQYVDTDGRRAPEYAATHIHVFAYYTVSTDPLGPLADYLRGLDGCLWATEYEAEERVGKRPSQRPHVEALFQRMNRNEDGAADGT